MKHHDKLAHTFTSVFIIEGSQDRKSKQGRISGAGSEARGGGGGGGEGEGGVLLAILLLSACSACFFIEAKSSSPRVAPPTMAEPPLGGPTHHGRAPTLQHQCFRVWPTANPKSHFLTQGSFLCDEPHFCHKTSQDRSQS